MKGSSSSLIIMIQAVALMIMVVVPVAVLGQTPSECNDEKNKLENGCRAVIFGRDPTEACCQQVRAAHLSCVCPLVTPALVAAIGGAQRVIRLVRGCGRTVPRNFKCGSLTSPA
ncbi:hypothetical protein ACP275_08G187900 [Erythranthe tilingii]